MAVEDTIPTPTPDTPATDPLVEDILDTSDLDPGNPDDPDGTGAGVPLPTSPAPVADPNAAPIPTTVGELTAWQAAERERIRAEYAPTPTAPAAPATPTVTIPPAPHPDLFYSNPDEYQRLSDERTQAFVLQGQTQMAAMIAPYLQQGAQNHFVATVDPKADDHQREYLSQIAKQSPAMLDPQNQNPATMEILRRASRDYSREKAGGKPPAAAPAPATPAKPATAAKPAPMSPESAYSGVRAAITPADRQKYGPLIATIGEEAFLNNKKAALKGDGEEFN